MLRPITKNVCLICGACSWIRRLWKSGFGKKATLSATRTTRLTRATEGDIFFGTTIIYPGKVGIEYHLTRGHCHRKRNHAETYQAISGHGLVLFEREDGTTTTAELAPGKVTYVAPFWAHRSVNTSGLPLVFLWICSVEASHDYEGLGGRGMRQVVVERRGLPSVEDHPSA